MKKSVRLFIKGNLQSMFFEQFIKQSAERIGVRGYFRKLEDGRVEIFIEGNSDKVDEMSSLCKKGTQHTQIRGIEERDERFQDFKDFKVMRL